MKDGNFTFYAIQFRVTHESPHLEPEGKLEPVEDKNWQYTGKDSWGYSLDPHIGTGNDWRPRNRTSSDELFNLKMATGYEGWHTFKYALAAFKRLKRDDANGKYDYTDCGNKIRAVRHEFRIVEITMAKATKVLTVDDVLEAA